MPQTVADDSYGAFDQFLLPVNNYYQQEPAVARLASGGFIVTWVAGQSVKTQIFDRNGDKVGAEQLVRLYGFQPTVIGLNSGGYIVSWEDSGPGMAGVKARIFDAAGSPVSDILDLPGSDGGRQQPSLVALPSGGFAGVWTDTTTSGSSIKLRIFDEAGAPLTAEIPVAAHVALNSYFPQTAVLPGGNIVVTWTGPGPDDSTSVNVRIFSASGAPVAGPFLANTANGQDQSYQSVTVLESGNFVITWTEATAGGTDTVRGQLFTAAGVKTGGEFQVNTIADRATGQASVTALDSGGFVVTWRIETDHINYIESGEIKGQVFDADGAKVGEEFLVNQVTDEGQGEPQVIAFGSNDFVILWQDWGGPEPYAPTLSARFFFDTTHGTEGGETLVGTDDRDFILGLGGDDTFFGGAGKDGFDGGAGDDIFYVDAGDILIERAGEGRDIAYASSNYALAPGAHVEILSPISLSGTDPLQLSGNELNNEIYGNAGANILRGGGGADLLLGGYGDDIYYTTSGAETIFEYSGQGRDIVYASLNHALAAGSHVEVLSAISVSGTDPLQLSGNELDNEVYGNAGANVLRGGGGSDLLLGGFGNDDYYITSGAETIFEYADQGRDIIYTNLSHTLAPGSHVEILSTIALSSTDPLNFGGNELDNQIYGNAGSNLLYGGGGFDFLVGGYGDDTYYILGGNELLFEGAGQGRDIAYADVSYVLNGTAQIEILSASSIGGASAIDLTGNEFAQEVDGNNGANILDGKDGSDLLVGYGGADTFAFTTALAASNVDYIHDFASGTDRIALDDAIFAGLAPGALPAGAFVAGAAAQDLDDRIVYDSASGQLFFDADGSGAGAAVQFASFAAGTLVAASDFQVI